MQEVVFSHADQYLPTVNCDPPLCKSRFLVAATLPSAGTVEAKSSTARRSVNISALVEAAEAARTLEPRALRLADGSALQAQHASGSGAGASNKMETGTR